MKAKEIIRANGRSYIIGMNFANSLQTQKQDFYEKLFYSFIVHGYYF